MPPGDARSLAYGQARIGGAFRGEDDEPGQRILEIAISTGMVILIRSGAELARRLRTDPMVSSVKIVAISAYPTEADKTTALAAGCDEYVFNPVNTCSVASVTARQLE